MSQFSKFSFNDSSEINEHIAFRNALKLIENLLRGDDKLKQTLHNKNLCFY